MSEYTTVKWDLGDLYNGINDPAIEKTLDDLQIRVGKFADEYRSKIDNDNLDAKTLLNAILEYESIMVEMSKPICYASLVFSADTSLHENGAFFQYIQERQTQIALELIFFDLELMSARPEIIDKLLEDEILCNYRHFVHAARLFRDHRLSELEEKILEEKANTGSRAFERLFEETLSDIIFKVKIDGEEKELTEPEALALLREPDREVRKAAAEGFSKGLADHSRILTFIFNTMVYDKSVDDRLRRYEYPEQARNTSNELDVDTVETVIKTCTDNYSLVERYYKTKRDILGYDKLTHYDRYAPLFESKETMQFDEAKEIVLSSFERFSKDMKAAAEKFFENSWIDAEPRKGKRGGAFCMYVTPDLHPYVLMSYLDKKDDIMTLGHELGHGVHAYLAREQSLVNYSSTLPVAELASTFGEMLVFESLVAESDLDEKLALYAEKIESVFATIFRQAAMYKFEQDLHNARRTGGELTREEIGTMWQNNIQAMFGDSVVLEDEHRDWWMYVNHFIGSPFYVYAYSFGELLVMALYSMYKEQGESFVPKYVDMLKTGGACSPQDLLGKVGIDIKSPAFWQGGMTVVEKLIADFESLYNEWKKK